MENLIEKIEPSNCLICYENQNKYVCGEHEVCCKNCFIYIGKCIFCNGPKNKICQFNYL